MILGVHCCGGYAAYLRLPARNCVPISPGLPFAEATLIARHYDSVGKIILDPTQE
jgi:NADPH:quinone reductase-like Zn-dependent oxidoreductase